MNRLTSLILAAAFVLVFSMAHADEMADQEAKDLLIKVKNYYGQAIGFEADYTLLSETAQLTQGAQSGQPAETSGLIIFVRPDRLRIIQEKPEEEEVVYSPDGYWWYSRKENEAHRFPAADVAGTVGPFVSFFSGLETAAQYFDVKRLVSFDKPKEKLKAVRLVPKSMQMGLTRLDVMIRENGEISRVSLFTLVGDSFIYIFNTVKLLREPPDIGFHFTPPEGTKVVHH